MIRYERDPEPAPRVVCAVVARYGGGFAGLRRILAELRRICGEVEASRAERRGWPAARRLAFLSPWVGSPSRRDSRREIAERTPALGTCVLIDGPPRRGPLAGLGGVLVS